MGLQPNLRGLCKQMVKLDEDHLEQPCSSERLFSDSNWRKCCSCSSHRGWCQHVAERKGSQLSEDPSNGCVPSPVHTAFIHTILVFVENFPLDSHLGSIYKSENTFRMLFVFGKKRSNSFLVSNLFRSKGKLIRQLFWTLSCGKLAYENGKRNLDAANEISNNSKNTQVWPISHDVANL